MLESRFHALLGELLSQDGGLVVRVLAQSTQLSGGSLQSLDSLREAPSLAAAPLWFREVVRLRAPALKQLVGGWGRRLAVVDGHEDRNNNPLVAIQSAPGG
jgi:hypothetical protein